MKQIQTALELFFNDKNRYPTPEEFALGSIFSTSTNSTSTYMRIIPTAPTPADGPCTGDQNTVYYQQTESGNSYTVSFCLGNTTGALTAGPKCLTPSGVVNMDCGPWTCGQDTVQYDGGPYNSDASIRNNDGYYRTVQIGSQCWLKDDINAGVQITPYIDHVGGRDNCVMTNYDSYDHWSCQQDDNQIEKYCYDNDLNNCLNVGGLYEWHEALQLPGSCFAADCSAQIQPKHQGICPSGWHVPSDGEWSTLEAYLADPSGSCDPNRIGFDCSPAGNFMRDPNEMNIIYDGVYYSYDNSYRYSYGTYYTFTTDQYNLNRSYGRLIHESSDGIYRWTTAHKADGISIRCLKD